MSQKSIYTCKKGGALPQDCEHDRALVEVDLFDLLAVEMVPGVSWPRQGEDRAAPPDVVEDDEAAAADLAAPALCTAGVQNTQTSQHSGSSHHL